MAESVAERLALQDKRQRQKIIKRLTDAEAQALLYDWSFWARPEQMEPDGQWDIWLLLAGRGFGKTRTGAEWVRKIVEEERAGKIALVAETAADARDVMVDSLLRCFPPDRMPVYTKSARRVDFTNGAVAFTYNATEPDQLRGPEHSAAWCDEIAKWRYGRETWDQLQFGLRLGQPRIVVTTTPRPIELVKSIVSGKEGKVHVTRGRTYDNRANLSQRFLERIEARYAGTRLGRQELDAEILGDLPNALWSQDIIDAYRVSSIEGLERIVVAVDPAVTSGDDSDEHGIIVAGIKDGEGYVIEDASLKGSPLQWSRRAASLVAGYQADGVVIEVNQGGDMVAHTLRSVAPNLNIIEVRASRGKHVRAEPIASLYEQGRVKHVGSFPELEGQMTQMTTGGYEGAGSPDRVDALVWALSELFPDIAQPIKADIKLRIPRSVGWLGT